jgi:carbonic anhydrase
MTPLQALDRLKKGHVRYKAGLCERNHWREHRDSDRFGQAQRPFAIVLGCSDSRAPLQLIFDQGIGDLFVVRVAGNIVAQSQLGSIEFAVENFATPLVLVLGHSECGAVSTAVDVVWDGLVLPSENMESISTRIQPCVELLLERQPGIDRQQLLQRAVGENVRFVVDHLCRGSDILQEKIIAGELLVTGAEYSLESGDVEFFQ